MILVIRSKEVIDIYLAALNDIASWKEGPTINSSFDEPASAAIAREALAKAATLSEAIRVQIETD